MKDEEEVVRETCQIAIDRIEWEQSSDPSILISSSSFTSIDPAPPSTTNDIETLKNQLMNTDLPLFKRYRAMFTLRNLGTKQAIDALALGFNDKSALFRCVSPIPFHSFLSIPNANTLPQTRNSIHLRPTLFPALNTPPHPHPLLTHRILNGQTRSSRSTRFDRYE